MAWLNTDIWHKCYIHVQVWELSVKKGKKKTKNLWIQIIKAHILGFFSLLACISSSTFLYIIYYLTFQQFFLISRSKRDKLQELKFLALMLYSVHVYKYESYLPYDTTIFNRTLTKASNCCSTTSQTILDLSPLVGEPPFTTLYREIIYRLVSDMT